MWQLCATSSQVDRVASPSSLSRSTPMIRLCAIACTARCSMTGMRSTADTLRLGRATAQSPLIVSSGKICPTRALVPPRFPIHRSAPRKREVIGVVIVIREVIVIGVQAARVVGRIGGAARAAAAGNVEDKVPLVRVVRVVRVVVRVITTHLKSRNLLHLLPRVIILMRDFPPLMKWLETRCSWAA